MTDLRVRSDVDISSVAFWSSSFDERDRSFAWLRQHAPVSWQPPLETPGLPPQYEEPGFWAVCTAADIGEVSHHHELYSSGTRKVRIHRAHSLNTPVKGILQKKTNEN